MKEKSFPPKLKVSEKWEKRGGAFYSLIKTSSPPGGKVTE